MRVERLVLAIAGAVTGFAVARLSLARGSAWTRRRLSTDRIGSL